MSALIREKQFTVHCIPNNLLYFAVLTVYCTLYSDKFTVPCIHNILLYNVLFPIDTSHHTVNNFLLLAEPQVPSTPQSLNQMICVRIFLAQYLANH